MFLLIIVTLTPLSATLPSLRMALPLFVVHFRHTFTVLSRSAVTTTPSHLSRRNQIEDNYIHGNAEPYQTVVGV
jgi:hypothetical protein